MYSNGDWGLGVWGFGVWGVGGEAAPPRPQHQTPHTHNQTPQKKKK